MPKVDGIEVLRQVKANPSLKVTLMQVDYDKEKALERQLHVTAQSTLIVLHGATERSRSTGETDPARLADTQLQQLKK